jgi:hypothetical protein
LSRFPFRFRARLAALAVLPALAAASAACGALPFEQQPAAGYAYGSDAPLRVAIIDETGGNDWSPAVKAGIATYSDATPYLRFQAQPAGANIVVHVRRYDDGHPPEIKGYVFPFGAGGFATVYDEAGLACNYPPSPLPLNCSGEIADATIYLNDIIPDGPDIEARRERLVLHELGHAMGLTRHSPDLDIAELAQRYGWE